MCKIMIVDDELISQEMIQEYIEARLPFYDVAAVCNNGQEALYAFLQNPADIILVDIRMPVMDGLTFLENLNKISHDYVPIIISSYGEFEYAKTAMRLGVTNYLLKPLDFRELTVSLEAAARTLSMKRSARNSLSYLDEDQEIFLCDLLNGRYSQKADALETFRPLNFPFAYDASPGVYLHIDFIMPNTWLYGKDALYTAISNLIDFTYFPVYQMPLVRKHTSCNFFLILKEEKIPAFEELNRQAQKLLGLTLSIHLLLKFSSVESLRMCCAQELPTSEEQPADTDIEANIKKALAYIEEHYADDLTRDDIASKVFMSGSYFSRWFKEITKTTYKDYLTEIRMQKSMELLKTNLQIQDIAAKVGYSSATRFNINFKMYTNYTPSEYRTKVLKID